MVTVPIGSYTASRKGNKGRQRKVAKSQGQGGCQGQQRGEPGG